MAEAKTYKISQGLGPDYAYMHSSLILLVKVSHMPQVRTTAGPHGKDQSDQHAYQEG